MIRLLFEINNTRREIFTYLTPPTNEHFTSLTHSSHIFPLLNTHPQHQIILLMTTRTGNPHKNALYSAWSTMKMEKQENSLKIYSVYVHFFYVHGVIEYNVSRKFSTYAWVTLGRFGMLYEYIWSHSTISTAITRSVKSYFWLVQVGPFTI